MLWHVGYVKPLEFEPECTHLHLINYLYSSHVFFGFPFSSGDKPNHYGQQRLWGAVGWGLFTFVAGFLVDEMSKNQFKKDYTIAFYIVMINVILSIVVSYQLKVSTNLPSSSVKLSVIIHRCLH